ARHGCMALTDVAELVGLVDAASVAVSSSRHAEVGCLLLEAGVPCLIEKPLATNEADGLALIQAAEERGLPLLVGHIERFNPAVDQLREILRDDHDVLAVDARRMSAVSSRITDVDVVADLMVHDLDIVLDLLGAAPVDVVARGAASDGGSGENYVIAVLTF